ncbi:MAG: cupin domain-containing protein [Bryobacteraceae bacterium]
MRFLALAFLCGSLALAAERAVDPTFLHRHLPDVKAQPADITSLGCTYKPLFGAGDSGSDIVKGVARYGEITVEPGGASELVSYPREEQIYVILEGEGVLHYGDGKHPVRRHDFMYLPPGVRHGLSNTSGKPCRAIAMGFKIPANIKLDPPGELQVANIDEVKKQVVGNHPPSTLYQLLMGDVSSKRDRIAAGRILTSLFVMEFAPGGTNFPHHHDREEEIYLLLEGEGEMVAGGGAEGVEGRRKAKPGDAYFYRLNATVGFYNSDAPGTKTARILAIRSLYPFRSR